MLGPWGLGGLGWLAVACRGLCCAVACRVMEISSQRLISCQASAEVGIGRSQRKGRDASLVLCLLLYLCVSLLLFLLPAIHPSFSMNLQYLIYLWLSLRNPKRTSKRPYVGAAVKRLHVSTCQREPICRYMQPQPMSLVVLGQRGCSSVPTMTDQILQVDWGATELESTGSPKGPGGTGRPVGRVPLDGSVR